MSDPQFPLDYGENLVLRYGGSGLTRREFAAQAGISVSTLDYYIRRERKASSPARLLPDRILPVDLIGAGEESSGNRSPSLPGGILIHLPKGRLLEVQRGFDEQLLVDVLAVLETQAGERG